VLVGRDLRFGDSRSYHMLQEKTAVNDEMVTSLSDDNAIAQYIFHA
jgi:hypothetical protein